jgi:predicted nucleotidyltransferase
MRNNKLKTESDIRAFLIAEAFRFIDRIVSLPGVRRIALVGSLTTGKTDPKDADILVTVEDDTDLTALATAARKLKGSAQTRNKGADVFLANPAGRYIGRLCHWRECVAGIRAACDARHCGARHFLHDDLDAISLDPVLVQAPPVEVWPCVVCREAVPGDIAFYLSRFQTYSGAS